MDETESKKNLTTPEFKQMLGALISYFVQHLGIQKLPTLKLVDSQKNANNLLGLTGHYDHEKKQITIYITDRHEIDQLKTICHELIHHWQNERGTLHPEERGLRGNNDAQPHYAQNNMWLRKREMEAYLLGALLYRDCVDEQRYGPLKTNPILPRPYD